MSKYQVIGTLKVRTPAGVRELGPGEIVTLPEHMAEPLLSQGRIKPIMPSLDPDGSLKIPFGADPRYCWWLGGWSVEKIVEELRKGKGLLN